MYRRLRHNIHGYGLFSFFFFFAKKAYKKVSEQSCTVHSKLTRVQCKLTKHGLTVTVLICLSSL